jgi:hypothetical protein
MKSPLGAVMKAGVAGDAPQPTLMEIATAYLGGIAPYHYWDFTTNRAIYAGEDIGAVTDTPGWSVTGGSLVRDATGLLVTVETISATAGITYPCTLWVEFERATDTGAGETYLQLFADADNRAAISVSAGDAIAALSRAGGVQVASIAPGSVATGIYKVASRVASTNFQAVLDGVLGTPDITGNAPSAPSAWHFGHQNGANFINNKIRRAAAFNSALSDADLQACT